MPQPTELEARAALVRVMRAMDAKGLNRGTSGNVSLRWGEGLLVTPSGVVPDDLTPESIVLLDAEGRAAEGALKLQEMGLTTTETYHPLEYRHGPISVADHRSLVIMLYHPDTRDQEEKLAAELSGFGALVLGFGGPGDLSLEIRGSDEVRGLVCLPALQLLGLELARTRGLDPRAPRHLTKVVKTVS